MRHGLKAAFRDLNVERIADKDHVFAGAGDLGIRGAALGRVNRLAGIFKRAVAGDAGHIHHAASLILWPSARSAKIVQTRAIARR